jgi:hypothetical protein
VVTLPVLDLKKKKKKKVIILLSSSSAAGKNIDGTVVHTYLKGS